ncbi:MAG: hypothetical protein KKF42_04420 [Actinobacteria bacterium]|nr:hypothetical protein [Actinomycetota bacterium]
MRKILIATPCYGGQVTDLYMRSVIGLIHDGYRRGVQVDVLAQYGESLITRARQDILATFWAGDWTDLLFIDSDIGFIPENVWRLLDSEWDVCATPYPLKRLDWESALLAPTVEVARHASVETVINYLPNAEREGDFIEVLDAGTGFLRISRDAIELLIASFPALEYEAEGGGQRWALFDTFIYQGRYLSEDFAFCRRWQHIGGKVMVDSAGPALQHRGLYTYGEE